MLRRLSLCLMLIASGLSCSENKPTPPKTPSATRVEPPREVSKPVEPKPVSPVATVKSAIHFTDEAKAVGINFVDHAPISREGHIHLYMGSGLAWCDYDRDGWPDMHINQGTPYPAVSKVQRQTNRFFRNFAGRFTDVTQTAGLTDFEHSLGVAAGDFDNDGFTDLYVTNFGRNCLYRNNGDGTFTDVAAASGTDSYGLPASCTWADIDNDGLLDLYCCYYLDIDPAHPADYPVCRSKKSRAEKDVVVKAGAADVQYVTCHPRYQKGKHDVLFHNRGDGKFDNISESAGLHSVKPCPGLGVVAADFDDDGDVDFFVANDSVENQLWQNQGNLKFVDVALSSGTAVNRDGSPQACMGIGIGDIEREGRLDLFVTNYFRETNTFYRNLGGMLFQDVTDELGLAAPSRLRLGFGANFIDPDNDGWLDLIVVNGHVDDRVQSEFGRQEEPFMQLAQMYLADKGRRFREISATAGPYFQIPRLGRGTAAADYDRDGRIDVAVHNLNLPMALLHNDTPEPGQWISIELIGRQCNRDGVGAKVFLKNGNRNLLRPRLAGNSYLSADEEQILVGLGTEKSVELVRVLWPGGRIESWKDLPAGKLHRLFEGTGTAELRPDGK